MPGAPLLPPPRPTSYNVPVLLSRNVVTGLLLQVGCQHTGQGAGRAHTAVQAATVWQGKHP
jgi:hypothetical protein